MSAPQPPADGHPRPDHDDAGPPSVPGGPKVSGGDPAASDPARSYDFHGEQLDFDPYRFGRPEPVAPAWTPPAPGAAGGPAPAPGERWSPGGGAGTPAPRPGDYWGGGSGPGPTAGQDPGAVFPPAGYAPSSPDAARPDGGTSRVDLGKPAGDARPAHLPTNYPPPGYPAPGQFGSGYPVAPGTGPTPRGNAIAVWGFVLGILGLLLAVFTWPGILVGLVGLGLSIAGLVRARRGARLKGLAIAGVACSVVAVAVGTVALVWILSRVDLDCVVRADGDTRQAQECIR